MADLSRLGEFTASGAAEFQGTAGLARMVMYSATKPWLTRAMARYELALEASRDAELSEELQQSVDIFYGLAREVVAQWHSGGDEPDSQLIDAQALAVFTYINGVMMSFVSGRPVVEDADQLHRLIEAVIDGVTRMRVNQPRIAD